MLYKLMKYHNWSFETIVDIQVVNDLFCICNEKWIPMFFSITKENSDVLISLIRVQFNKEPLIYSIYEGYKYRIEFNRPITDEYMYFISELEKKFSDIILLYEMGCQR